MKTYKNNLFDYLDINIKNVEENINEGIIDFFTKDFDMLPIPSTFGLNVYGYTNIKDLRYQKISYITSIIAKNKKELFVNWMSLIEKGKDYYINEFEKYIEKIDNINILKRRILKESLEEISKSLYITRERVRQIEISVIKDAYTYIYPLLDFIKIEDEKLFFHFYESFNTKRENENLFTYIMLQENKNINNYDKDFKEFYNKKKEQILFKVKKRILENDLFHIYDMYVKINNNLIYQYNILDFSYESYKQFLDSTDHYYAGKLVTKSKNKYTNKLLSKVIYFFYPKGIVLDEEGIKELEKKVYEKYQYHFLFTSTISNIDELNPELIIYGKQMRTHIDNVYIKESKKEEIISRFENVFSNYSYMLIDDIYNKLYDVLEGTVIKDKYQLYGYLKYYLKDKYYFKKMAVRNLTLKDKTISTIVYDYIKDNPNKSLKEIADFVDMDEKSVLSIIRDDKRILATEEDYQLVISFSLSKESKETLYNIITSKLIIDYDKLQFGYVHRDNLYDEYHDTLLKMGITSSSMLFQIVRYYFDKKFNFFVPYIQIKEINYQVSFKKIISDYFLVNKGIIDIEKAQKDIGILIANKNLSLIYNLRTYNIDYFRMGYDRMALLENIRFEEITEYMIESRLSDYFKDHVRAFEKDLDKIAKGLYYYLNDEKCYMNYYSLASYLYNKNKKLLASKKKIKYNVLNSLGINNYLSSKYAISIKEKEYLDAMYQAVREAFPEKVNNKIDIIRFLKNNNILTSVPLEVFSDYATYEEDKILFND